MLKDKYIDIIKSIITKYLSEYDLYLFGSRAKGTAREYSDIDLAISSKELNSLIKSQIEIDFENSLIPWKIDVVDLNNIDDNFKSLIENTMIKL